MSGYPRERTNSGQKIKHGAKEIEILPAKKCVRKSTTRLVWHKRCKEKCKWLYKLSPCALRLQKSNLDGLNFLK